MSSSSSSVPRAKPWESTTENTNGNTRTHEPVMTAPASIEEEREGPDMTIPKRPASLVPPPQQQESNYNSNTYGGSYSANSYGGNYNSSFGGGTPYGYGHGYGYGYNSLYNDSGMGMGMGMGMNNGMYGGGGNGMMNNIGDSTRATFQLIESIIGAVTGFAQMLESSYLATHNSFFTMISVAEQFSYLKESLGSFLGIFTVIKFLKKILYRTTKGRMGKLGINGRSDNSPSSMIEEFKKFANNNGGNEKDEGKKRKRISWKPLIVFLMAVFGFPYLLNKFIARLNENQQKFLKNNNKEIIDPNKIEFARALYDFVPENPQIEAELKKGELMAIISQRDPVGRESNWWKVRTKDGSMGYVPYNYIEVIKRTTKRIEDVDEN
ncbi:hypothetical protein NCAS_0E02790 [Naumovozyma castellii]|uniref:Peroxisomal membrane protein PEX13 n=1 Tax=Naumovozyma castellii TaxID=27288 RepID=G0VFT2_NAUCA|nr:hypothetical protein NCAS_0E02790 [Naumovozyma castellii CBS 4309]CCC70349.1 hypothetical protein NCAS_0E02790 [Naumovozyma castellii CBS 4309]